MTPLMVILLVQSLILFALILSGGVSQRLHSNAIDILNESTENGKLQMERELVNHWMRDIETSGLISDAAENVLEQQGKTAAEIGEDPDLNREILYGIMTPLIELLHRSYGTGIFVILDGPAAPNSEADTRAGVYIRDLDPSSYAYDNADLLLERGLPSISKEYGIPLDSFWKLGFSAEDCENGAYFHNSYDLVRDKKVERDQAGNYGYLGSLTSLDPMDTKVITYTIPLILSDGTVIGVVGGDMTESQLGSVLNAGGTNNSVIRVLGKRKAGEMTITPLVTSGALFDNYFGKEAVLCLEDSENKGVSQVKDKKGNLWYASVGKLDTYNNNTPFNSEEWVLVHIIEGNSLFAFYTQIKETLTISLLVALLFGILAVLTVGSIITNPIRRLIRELRETGKGKSIVLQKTNIEEIDELIGAVERLSEDVAASSSKISNILEASGIPMGVFEYREDTGRVFCSRSFFELLQTDGPEASYVYLEEKDFVNILRKLRKEEQSKDGELFSFEGADGIHWIRMRQVREAGESRIGVLTDITTDVMERKRLEQERNYDLLTNIYNRRAFRELAEQKLKDPPSESMAFIMWDLDNLKYVNDTYGHEEGDRYIRLFADYLKGLEREGAIVERHAGDEFMAVLPYGSREEQRRVIRNFMEQMKSKTLLLEDGYAIPLRASAGVAWYPDQAADFGTLVRYADFAMYMAKHSVKGIMQEFSPDSYRSNSYLLSGREELNHLLEKRKVRYALQPIVSRDGTVFGYEALMRPELEYLKSIQEVLYLAKSQAKLNQMEELTWLTAVDWFDQLERDGKLEPDTHFFINSIASACIYRKDAEWIQQSFPQYLKRIVLEMTETEPNEEYMKNKLTMLKQWGAMLAIDDFGSGYNNEGLILKLHPQIVKLDIGLVRFVDKDKERQDMLKGTIQFCHQQKILVVAEGVETKEELETLMDMEIDLFQGYYLGRPEIDIRPLDPYIVTKMRQLSLK